MRTPIKYGSIVLDFLVLQLISKTLLLRLT
jgi:hypothetical protein